MKRIHLTACLLFLVTAVSSLPAQPITPQEQTDQQLLALLAEVQIQQAAIAMNQAKIDEKIAAAAEALRMARIYSSRSGR